MTVSIIIPVYNSAAYLPVCLDSILSQIFTDFEVLLVDDGSTDGSEIICDEYASKDNRIRVFHKENGGVSSARNLALDNAMGEWVTFVDSDDWIEQGYLSTPHFQDVQLYVRNWKFASGEDKYSLDPQYVSADSFRGFLQSNIHLDSFRTACCSFFLRKILNNHHIRFMEGFRLGEDTLFVMDYYKYCSSLQVLDGPSYIYNRPNDWENKYRLSLSESLGFLDAFWTRYNALNIESERLILFMLNFFWGMVYPKDKVTKLRWSFSETVLKCKKTLLPGKGILYRLKYYVKLPIAKVWGYLA